MATKPLKSLKFPTLDDTYTVPQVDDTLTVQGAAADAKKVGDELTDIKGDISQMSTATASDVGKALFAKTVADGKVTEWEFGEVGGADPSVIEQAVNDWLDEHPEATTTVEDGSITTEKLASWTVPFVYPEQFGAVGDGVTDDAPAIQSAINYCIQTGKDLVFMPKTYGVVPYQQDKSIVIYNSTSYALIINGKISIDLNGATIKLLTNTIGVLTVVHIISADGAVLKNGTIIGDRDTFTVSGDNSQLLDMFECKNCIIDSVIMKESKGDCFGHSGVQKGQPYVTQEFSDYYMGNLISNCVMSHSTRHGMTFSKGRGVTFFNCGIENVRSEGQISYEGMAVDMEPYYGLGSVYDIRFVECSMKNNSGGPYVQACNDVRFCNCFLQDIAFRGAVDCLVYNCTISGGIGINTASVTLNGNRIGALVTIKNDLDYLTNHGILVDTYILNNICEGRILVNTSGSSFLIGDIVITGNVINDAINGAVVAVIGKNNNGETKSIKIENNRLYNIYDGQISSGGFVISINKTPKAIIRNNSLIYDVRVATQGSEIISCEKIEELIFTNNIIQFEELQDVTYGKNLRRILRLKDISKNAVLQNNIINPEGNTMSTFPLYLVKGESSTEDTPDVVAMNNYMNGLTGINNPNDGVANVIVNFGNAINNVINA